MSLVNSCLETLKSILALNSTGELISHFAWRQALNVVFHDIVFMDLNLRGEGGEKFGTITAVYQLAGICLHREVQRDLSSPIIMGRFLFKNNLNRSLNKNRPSSAYINLEAWALEHNCSWTELANRRELHTELFYRSFVHGETSNPGKRSVDKLLSIPGLAYEQLFPKGADNMKKPSKKDYFGQAASERSVSCSHFKPFQKCEAAALAEIRGELVRPKSTALLVGSYVDSFFEGTFAEFKEENPEIFERDGSLKSEHQHAETIIRCIERDKLFSMFLSGRKQMIKVGEIAGVPFKIKMDCLLTEKRCESIAKAFPETESIFEFAEGAIVDLKVMRDFEPIWSEEHGAKVGFIKAWGY